MLNKLYIDGFRSLLDFRIGLQPGLNILVGANGTGKSNFIAFLDFAADLVDFDLNTAIAGAHGAGAVFSKERFIGDESAEFTFTVEGDLRPADPEETSILSFGNDSTEALSGSYSYSCTISYLASIPAVYISREVVEMNSSADGVNKITRTTNNVEDGFQTRVVIDPPEHKINKTIFRLLRRSDNKLNAAEFLAARLSPERTILTYLAGETVGHSSLVEDLIGHRSLNVDPSMARKPTPVGSIVNLKANGDGLAGALYRLKNGNYYPSVRMRRLPQRRTAGPETFKSIMSWCREVNADIQDVNVELNPMEAQLRPFMTFNMGNRSEKFSFSRISDGTVKWLTLATALFAERGLDVVEEPENFLHPFMQEAFIALCRSAILRVHGRSIIISTHSPTVLDCCAPSELTMFELVDGQSRASRIANRDQLAEKIRTSRFGVGYYYKIGALYGEDSGNS